METILIFTDGASKGNPGPGGWGAVVALQNHVRELGGRDDHTTNNRMELKGALEGLVYVSSLDNGPVTLHTDSSYVINGVTKWAAGWKARNWMTLQKQPVLNQDLWQSLLAVVEAYQHPISWKYVGGHVGVAGNERVDEIASNFAEKIPVELYDGTRTAYGVDIANLGHDESMHKAKSDSRTRSKAKAFSYVSKVDGVVMTHKTWGECEARVKGKSARFKKATSPEEEAQIIAAFSA